MRCGDSIESSEIKQKASFSHGWSSLCIDVRSSSDTGWEPLAEPRASHNCAVPTITTCTPVPVFRVHTLSSLRFHHSQ
jgi:hypothetical protein